MAKFFKALSACNRFLCWVLFWGCVGLVGYLVLKFSKPQEVESFPYIARIDILGQIVPGFTDQIKQHVEAAYSDQNSKMVLLYFNSSGGSGVESWRFCDYIKGKRALEAKKPENERRATVAVIAEMGTSAAYHMAICADTTYASPQSQIGSVGAIIMYKESEQKEFKNISSNKGKVFDLTTAESQQVAKELVDEGAEVFLQDVLSLRGSRLKIDSKTLASGRMWSGKKGVEIGLVDGYATPESISRNMNLPVVWSGMSEPTLWDKAKDVLSVLRAH